MVTISLSAPVTGPPAVPAGANYTLAYVAPCTGTP